MKADLRTELIKECERQQESALYHACQLFMWLRDIRWAKRRYLIAQLILGAAAVYFALEDMTLAAGITGAVAGVAPSIWDSLKLDAHEEAVAHYASEFTRIRDQFRHARTIGDAKGIEPLEEAFNQAMAAMNAARTSALAAPEHYYKKAQAKIHAGDYNFEIDTTKTDPTKS